MTNVVFQEYDGVLVGIGVKGRRWRLTPSASGWQLEFRDVGDGAATYAGTFANRSQAMAEAARQYLPGPLSAKA